MKTRQIIRIHCQQGYEFCFLIRFVDQGGRCAGPHNMAGIKVSGKLAQCAGFDMGKSGLQFIDQYEEVVKIQ